MSSLRAMVGPPFTFLPGGAAARTRPALFHARFIAREGLRLAPIREPQCPLNLPAVIKLHRPGRAPKCHERQWLPTAPGSSAPWTGAAGRRCFPWAAGIQPRFSRQVNAGVTCGNVNAGVLFRGCTGKFAGTGASCASRLFHRSQMIDFGTAGWIRTTDLLIHSQAL